jgi:hypothetical protein
MAALYTCQIGNARWFLASRQNPREHFRMRLLMTGLLVAAGMSGTALADGDALVDMLGPREIAVGEAMRAGATGATGIGLNPAGIPLNRELVFEGGYGYRQADQASLVGVSACDSTNAVPGCFFYEYAGANPDLDGMSLHSHTHIAGASLSYLVTPRIAIGSTLKYFHLDSDLMNMPSASGFNQDVGATIRLTDMVNVGVAGYNLWSTNDSAEFPTAVGGGVLARPIPILSLSYDMRWETNGTQQKARYGGGAELFLRNGGGTSAYPLRAGLLHDNNLAATYLSGGVGYAGMKYGIDIAARFAVSGPSDTLVIASMRFFGPRQPAPGVE